MNQPLPPEASSKSILYFSRRPGYYEQWAIINSMRIDLPDLVNPTLKQPGRFLTHWPTRLMMIFDEVKEV